MTMRTIVLLALTTIPLSAVAESSRFSGNDGFSVTINARTESSWRSDNSGLSAAANIHVSAEDYEAAQVSKIRFDTCLNEKKLTDGEAHLRHILECQS